MTATRFVVIPRRSAETYYVVRPQVNLGSDVWVGSPTNYSVVAVTPAPVPVLPVATGGMSLDITPSFASVYVDGNYVGTAANFATVNTPLILAPGPHHVKIKADDYKSMTFDTEIVPGQIVPYAGVMHPHKFWDIL